MNSATATIKPETVARLAKVAMAKGFRSIDDFVERSFPALLPEIIQAEDRPLYETLPPAELAEAFVQWARSHDRDVPALTLEDVSRESIYEDRW